MGRKIPKSADALIAGAATYDAPAAEAASAGSSPASDAMSAGELGLGVGGLALGALGGIAQAGMSLYALREQRKEAKKTRRANMALWREQKRMAEKQFEAEQGFERQKLGEQKVQNASDRYLGYVKTMDDMFSSNINRFATLGTLQQNLANRRR